MILQVSNMGSNMGSNMLSLDFSCGEKMWIKWEFDHEMEIHNGISLDFTMMIRVAPWPPQVQGMIKIS